MSPGFLFPSSGEHTRSRPVNPILLLWMTAILLSVPVAAIAQVGGVYIDGEGMLRDLSRLDTDERLAKLRIESAKPTEGSPLNLASKHRKVSLRRLEQSIGADAESVESLPVDQRYLAGLTRIHHIFFYPESDDVVIAGPAEVPRQLPSGEVVGSTTGRPLLQLADLLEAVRFVSDEQRSAGFIGCSIEPTLEGMKRHAAYMNSLGGRMDRSRLKQIFSGMADAMGPQAVKVYGVNPDSPFALKMIAADYRLKRIALGHEPAPVPGIVNYLDLAAKRLRNLSGPQPQHRWWFVAEYESIRHTPDDLAFELVGQGVRVATAPTSQGKPASATKKSSGKSSAPKATPSATQFATLMTKHFPEAAKQVPVFHELENLIALTVTAQLAAEKTAAQADQPVDTKLPLAALSGQLKSPALQTPRSVPSLVNYRLVRGRHWLICISGGVEIQPRRIIARQNREADDGNIATTRRISAAPEAPARWWWD